MHLGEVWKEFWYGVRKKHKYVICCNIFLWSLMNASLIYLISTFTSYLNDSKAMIFLVVVYVIFIIVFEVDEFMADWCNDYVWEMMSSYTAKYWLHELYYTSPKRLKDINSGYVSGLLNNHISSKRELLNGGLQGIVAIVFVLYSLFIYLSIHVYLGLSTFIVCAIAICIRIGTTQRIMNYQNPYYKSVAGCKREFMEASNNICTLQKLRLLDFFISRLNKAEKDMSKAFNPLELWGEGVFCAYRLVMYMLLPVNVLTCIYMNSIDVKFDYTKAMSYIVANTATMVHNLKYLYHLQKSSMRYIETYKQLKEVSFDKDISYVTESVSTFNKIEMRYIKFKYNDSSNEILVQDFIINKGDFISISGESGKGKTTMLNLLSGGLSKRLLYVDFLPYAGSLNPVYIAQDVEMFDMSLRDNLKLGNDKIDDSIIISMLETVGMSNWLSQQREGLDVILGERGIKVSTGQRQRLNLIRGLLIEGSLYFLDEPTSNVDDETELKIISLIKERLAGKTVVIVTHRPAIKKICNKEYEFVNNELLLKE